MSVLDIAKVDIISINPSGAAVLTISDHLDWTGSQQHLFALQTKINLYLEFIQNGNLYEKYPDACKRSVIIHICFKFQPIEEAVRFLTLTQDILTRAGYLLTYETVNGSGKQIL